LPDGDHVIVAAEPLCLYTVLWWWCTAEKKTRDG
jgi:hypothetical protein